MRLAHAFNSSAHYLSLTDLSLSFGGKSSIQSSLPRSWAIAEPWRGVRSLPVTSRLTSGHEASLLRALPSVVCLDLFTSLELDWDGKNKVLISTSLVRPRLSVNVTLSAPKMDLHQLALDLSPILASMVCLETLALHDNYGRNQSSLRRLPVSLLQHLPRSLRAATLHLRVRLSARASVLAFLAGRIDGSLARWSIGDCFGTRPRPGETWVKVEWDGAYSLEEDEGQD